MSKVIVWMPHHLPYLTWHQEISVRQCQRILSDYPIHLACPEGMDVSAITAIVPNLKIDYFDKKWFISCESYNFLKMSKSFYERYSQYEYLLTYELDCFVYKDELFQWCEKKFDYIGAPWFEGYFSASLDAKILGVGNSGFSLRRIAACLDVLNSFNYGEYFKEKLAKNMEKGGILSALREEVKNYFLYRSKYGKVSMLGPIHEDGFWCQKVGEKIKSFRIASVEDAISFSFEANPSRLYEKNNTQLPFGCHAWSLYNLEFWRPHIEAFGYKI